MGWDPTRKFGPSGSRTAQPLMASGLPLLHHIGFVTPPYPPEQMPPKSSNYRVLTASTTVRNYPEKGWYGRRRCRSDLSRGKS